jgi:hypothetical protein
MPRIEVQPESLSAGGARQAAMGERLHELSKRLGSTTMAAGAVAGDCAAGGSMVRFGETWASVLDMLATTVATNGENLGAAADAYVMTDNGVIRQPGS